MTLAASKLRLRQYIGSQAANANSELANFARGLLVFRRQCGNWQLDRLARRDHPPSEGAAPAVLVAATGFRIPASQAPTNKMAAT